MFCKSTRFAMCLVLGSLSMAAFAEPVSYRIDASHTDVIAQWSHLGFSNPIAHFGQVEGTIVHDAADVAASSVEVWCSSPSYSALTWANARRLGRTVLTSTSPSRIRRLARPPDDRQARLHGADGRGL